MQPVIVASIQVSTVAPQTLTRRHASHCKAELKVKLQQLCEAAALLPSKTACYTSNPTA